MWSGIARTAEEVSKAESERIKRERWRTASLLRGCDLTCISAEWHTTCCDFMHVSRLRVRVICMIRLMGAIVSSCPEA